MKNIKRAFVLFQKAQNDFKALSNMTNEEIFSEDIFGFHVQQSIEKSLKAWLAFIGVKFPKTHDIYMLLQLHKENGQDVELFEDFFEYSVYAVQFRYDQYDISGPAIDRQECIQQVSKLLNHVDRIINQQQD